MPLSFVAVQCPALQNLTNGFVSCGEDADTRFSYKNTCSFSCDQGYHLVGASRVTCTSGGTWNQQIPHCEGKRNTKSITHHLLYHEDTFNKIHMFLCQPSFARIQREKLPSSCSAVNLRLNCDQTPPAASAVKKVLNCREQTPSSVLRTDSGMKTYLHAKVWKTNYINIYYKQCYSSFFLGLIMSWHISNILLFCFPFVAKGCPAPEVPTNGQISCSPSLSSFLSHDTPHPLGMVCHFTCDEGHELQGAHSMECTHPGQWTSRSPTCTGTCEPILPGLLVVHNFICMFRILRAQVRSLFQYAISSCPLQQLLHVCCLRLLKTVTSVAPALSQFTTLSAPSPVTKATH